MQYLNERGIATRLLFCGNVTKQPYFIDNAVKFRAVGDLPNTDTVMNDTFWIGVYPGLGPVQIEYLIEQCGAFLDTASAGNEPNRDSGLKHMIRQGEAN